MAKAKKADTVVITTTNSQNEPVIIEQHIDTGNHTDFITKIHPLTQEFSNGDMNTLRDKINEIIRAK